MEFQRPEYPALLVELQPSQAVQVLNYRVEHVSRLNQDIADWLQERRRIEEVYVQGLKRLAKKSPPDESSELGIFTGPWAKIVSAADSLADSHHTLAQRIEADVEKPLRRFTSQNREYQSMTTVQGHLNTLTTEIGSAQEKAEKLRRKGEKASVGKVAGASSSIEDATTEFQSQAPFVFEQLQALDEIRFNHLRDVLTQFQTHEVDQVERERVIAESTLNSILNVETADEIKTWAERMKSGGVPSLQAKDRSSRKTFVPAFPPTSPPILDEPEDNHSLKGGFSESRPSQRSMTGTSEEPKKSHGLAGGLKRLGTRIGRRRDKQILPDQETPPKSSKGRFGELNRSSTALPITQSSPTPQLPLPDRSAAFARPLSPLRHQSQNEQSAKTPATTEPAGISLVNGESQSGAEIQKPQMNGILAKPLIPETAKPVESPFPSETVLNNPTIPPQEPIQLREVVSESTPLHQSPLMTPEVPGQRTPSSSRLSQSSNAALVPEDDPSSMAALESVQNALRSQQLAPPARTGPPRGRRSMYGALSSQTPFQPSNAISGISEEADTAPPTRLGLVSEALPRTVDPESADAIFSTTPPASAPSPFPPEVPKKIPESPLVQDAFATAPKHQSMFAFPTAMTPTAPPAPPPPRNSIPVFDPQQSNDSATNIFTAPIPASAVSFPSILPIIPNNTTTRAPSTAFSTAPQSDTASIHSSHSISSLSSMVPRHPDLGSFTGLRCSIIETINCSFLPTGQVNKFDSHGEIACAYQRDDEISDPKPRQLKLSGRNHIDRVVPSPSLLTANEMRGLEDEEAYELRVNLLSRQPVVALRYHLKAQPESTVPILLRPAWKIDNKTAGIILHYSINPSYTLHHPSPSITLKNFILIASITSNDTIPAISCQSKPAGVFSRERGIVYWRLGDVSLSTAEPSGNKVVARFMLTPGENPAAKPGNVEARFEIPGALATGDDQQRDLAGSSHPSVGLMECEFTEPKGKEKEIVGDADRDPFADEGEPDGTSTPTPARMRAENWRAVQGVRKVVSGRYLVVSEESRTG